MPALVLTDEQLRQAWRLLYDGRRGPSFDEAMADPMRSSLVRARATALLRCPRRTSPPVRRQAVPRISLPTIDCKRAAAGDRDD